MGHHKRVSSSEKVSRENSRRPCSSTKCVTGEGGLPVSNAVNAALINTLVSITARLTVIGRKRFEFLLGQPLSCGVLGGLIQRPAQSIGVKDPHGLVVARRHHDAYDPIPARYAKGLALREVDEFPEVGRGFVGCEGLQTRTWFQLGLGRN